MSLALPTEQDMVQLPDMTDWERMVADYGLLGLSPSYHPLALLRRDLPRDVLTAEQVRASANDAVIRTGGLVVCRQRPGTAKGFVFISLEDETGISNSIVTPDLFEKLRLVVTEEPFLLIEGQVQNTDNVVLVKAQRIIPLAHDELIGSESHDFR